MGLPKTCPNCFANDGIFWNYDGSEEEIKKIYAQKWCDCGYNSPEEMIEDLAKKYHFKFKNPEWVKIARVFIDRKNYKEDKRTIITLKELGEFLHNLYWSSEHLSLNLDIKLKEEDMPMVQYNWIETKDTFKRAEISEQANLFGIKDRTLSDILKRFIKLKLIEKVSHGIYTKT